MNDDSENKLHLILLSDYLVQLKCYFNESVTKFCKHSNSSNIQKKTSHSPPLFLRLSLALARLIIVSGVSVSVICVSRLVSPVKTTICL